MSQTSDNQDAINSPADITPWQPIETAPEGVLLTDQGTGRYINSTIYNGVLKSGWYLCMKDDFVPYCREDGVEVSFMEPQPKLWMRIPTLPPKGTY